MHYQHCLAAFAVSAFLPVSAPTLQLNTTCVGVRLRMDPDGARGSECRNGCPLRGGRVEANAFVEFLGAILTQLNRAPYRMPVPEPTPDTVLCEPIEHAGVARP